eukprot:1482071-Prymnesium_polylepis.1
MGSGRRNSDGPRPGEARPIRIAPPPLDVVARSALPAADCSSARLHTNGKRSSNGPHSSRAHLHGFGR